MRDFEEILEDTENSFVPNTETLFAEGLIPLNNLGGKTDNQSRCHKRKTMLSTKFSEFGDTNKGACDVGQPLKHQKLNENDKNKITQSKKGTSKSGKSLEATKKRFSRSTTRHCRRVEKHLLDIPEGDLDYSKLAMKDLIHLAEAKEKELQSCILPQTRGPVGYGFTFGRNFSLCSESGNGLPEQELNGWFRFRG